MAKNRKNKKKNKAASGVLSVVKTSMFVLLFVIFLYMLANYGFRRTVVRGVSMMDTLIDGDSIIMDEFSYRVGDPKRYDIICFKSYREKDLLIKRVIGLPGETVYIDNGTIYINDEIIKDKPGLETIEDAGLAGNKITLDDDEYFVIGDNRDESTDSRSADVGNVRRREILGRACLVIWPFDRIGVID